MCDICRQTICPSGCPNAPEWEPPKCCFCGEVAKWELDGSPVCNACLVDQSTVDADFRDMVSYVSESRDQWHNFLDFLLDFGMVNAETLNGTNFSFPSAVCKFCTGSDDFFEYLSYNKKVEYRAI